MGEADIIIKEEVETCFNMDTLQTTRLCGTTSSMSDKSLTSVDSTTYLPPGPASPPLSQSQQQQQQQPQQPQQPQPQQQQQQQQSHPQLQQPQLQPQQQQQQQQTGVAGATVLPDEETVSPRKIKFVAWSSLHESVLHGGLREVFSMSVTSSI